MKRNLHKQVVEEFRECAYAQTEIPFTEFHLRDSISVFQEPVLIKIEVQTVSCHRNVKIGPGCPVRTEGFTIMPFRVCLSRYPESI